VWRYYRDEYCSRRGAVEAYNSELLDNPAIKLALTQIDVAQAAIDNIVQQLEEAAMDEED